MHFPMIGKNFRGKKTGKISATKDTKDTKREGKRVGGMREEGSYKNTTPPASRRLKGGREADVLPERGRPARTSAGGS